VNRRDFLRVLACAWLGLPGFARAEPPPGAAAQVVHALRERRVLRFRYRGLTREVEPHAVGLGRAGQWVLLAWQAAGGSRSEPPPGWRTFSLVEMHTVRVLRRTFVPRSDFAPDKSGLQPVEWVRRATGA
jgi:predicted DNA-binding transcriptional regulator YafY